MYRDKIGSSFKGTFFNYLEKIENYFLSFKFLATESIHY